MENKGIKSIEDLLAVPESHLVSIKIPACLLRELDLFCAVENRLREDTQKIGDNEGEMSCVYWEPDVSGCL